jgi:hypothetical protein
MKRLFITITLTAVAAFGQQQINQMSDFAVGKVIRASAPVTAIEGTSPLTHPFTVVARHPRAGCANTAECGEIFYTYEGKNLRTSVGTTVQYGWMFATQPAIANYMGLSNDSGAPAMADTALASEIVANGLTRAVADSLTNSSTTLAVPAAPAGTVVGTTGSTTYYYWVAACNQGICTTPSAASTAVTTANATLSTTNYVSVAFTAVAGAATYQIYRTTSSSAPSGTVSVLVGGLPSCTSGGSCTALDQSNTLSSVTIPGSNLTNYGKAVLVHTWTCSTASQSAQKFGIFNGSGSFSAPTTNALVFEGLFTQVNLNVGDTFQLSWTGYF